MFLGLITLIVGLAISGVAAWFSVVGLMAIFAAATLPIAIMGGVLEVGKLLTASWLYQNWTTAPKTLKSYLVGSVIVLMLITSMGIFGFLSKAHIDQTILGDDNILKIELLNTQIERHQRRVNDAEKVIAQLDASIETLIEYDRIRGPEGAIAMREGQRVERKSLTGIVFEASDRINDIRTKRKDLSKEKLKYEADVGPIKYIAELFVKNSKEILDDAVRWVIISIIFVFDPLAILLIVAANISFSKPKPIRRAVNVDDNWKEFNVETDEELKFEVPEDIVQDPNNTVDVKDIKATDEDWAIIEKIARGEKIDWNEEDKGPYPKEIKSEKD